MDFPTRSKEPTPLRLARERLGLTIRQLREVSGIATGRLSMLERAMVKPNPLEQERLAVALGATLEELFPAIDLRPAPPAFVQDRRYMIS